MKWQLDADTLAAILEYAVHRADCQVVTNRREQRTRCTCGLYKALAGVFDEQRNHPERLICNGDAMAGRSVPRWLTDLVPHGKPLPYRPDRMNMPSLMSDG